MVIRSMCIVLPQLLAGLDVEERDREERCGKQKHGEILHSSLAMQ